MHCDLASCPLCTDKSSHCRLRDVLTWTSVIDTYTLPEFWGEKNLAIVILMQDIIKSKVSIMDCS
jgi:hypothetical protein